MKSQGTALERMASAVETNVWAMHVDFARIPGAEIHDGRSLLWFTVPSYSSWLNGASRTNLTAREADRAIATVVTDLAARGRNSKWHIGPSTRPADLPRRLSNAGFTPTDLDIPGMAVRVNDVNRPRRADGLTISAVRTDSDLETWLEAFDLAFTGKPLGVDHPWRTPFAHLSLPATSPFRLFLGRVDGRPVACSLGFFGGGAVGVYGVGTVPDERGRGYGSHMTVAALDWGALQGARLAILHASELGFPVYRALGFEAVCTVSQFLRKATSA